MKQSTQALLLSVFIFPGAGHVLLKRYVSAAIIAGAALTALYLLVSAAIEKAQIIVDKILSGEIPADVAKITELVLSQPNGNEAQLINIATTVLIVAWLIGIADAFRVGRSQDVRETPESLQK